MLYLKIGIFSKIPSDNNISLLLQTKWTLSVSKTKRHKQLAVTYARLLQRVVFSNYEKQTLHHKLSSHLVMLTVE